MQRYAVKQNTFWGTQVSVEEQVEVRQKTAFSYPEWKSRKKIDLTFPLINQRKGFIWIVTSAGFSAFMRDPLGRLFHFI